MHFTFLITFLFSAVIMFLMKKVAVHIGALDVPRTEEGHRHIHKKITPKLGAVACWADGPFSGDGHVAIVEQIDPDTGVITCSNSAYGGEYFYLTHLSPPDYLPAAGYVFQGFIYNPYTGGSPWWSGGKGWIFKRSLWHKEEALLK